MAVLDRDSPRRDATPAELKAMAHPLRLRIIRLCLHEALTNKQLADHLDQDPATVLHHVRTLCAAGFLEAEPARPAVAARSRSPTGRPASRGSSRSPTPTTA